MNNVVFRLHGGAVLDEGSIEQYLMWAQNHLAGWVGRLVWGMGRRPVPTRRDIGRALPRLPAMSSSPFRADVTLRDLCRTFDQILLLWQTPDQPFLLIPKSSEYLPVRWAVHSYHLRLPWSLLGVASSWLRHAWWSLECVVSLGSCGSTWLVCKAFWHSS